MSSLESNISEIGKKVEQLKSRSTHDGTDPILRRTIDEFCLNVEEMLLQGIPNELPSILSHLCDTTDRLLLSKPNNHEVMAYNVLATQFENDASADLRRIGECMQRLIAQINTPKTLESFLAQVDQALSDLEKEAQGFKHNKPLHNVLRRLLSDINRSLLEWQGAESKVIRYSFFDTVSAKLTARPQLVTPWELLLVCEKTLALLKQEQMSLQGYHHYVQTTCPGHPSKEMQLIGKSMLIIGGLFLLGTLLNPVLLMGLSAAGFLLVGAALYRCHGAIGLAKDAEEVEVAYEQHQTSPAI